MKTLLKIKNIAGIIFEALLTDPLNSRICRVVISLAGTWLGYAIGWVLWNKLSGY